jgi:hypothetical protein
MKTLLSIGLFLSLLLCTASAPVDPNYRTIKNLSFGPGEKIKYRVHYGFVNAAEGTMMIKNDLVNWKGRPCYHIEVKGETVGMFDLIQRVRDTWGTYIDTAAVIPHRFYRYIKEGKYRKNEVIEFDHRTQKATTILYEKEDPEKVKKTMQHEIPLNVQDLISGYYYMRTLNYDKMAPGDTTTITGFFEEEVFKFSVVFKGKERLKTKLGKLPAIKLVPVMPENKMFDGKNSVFIWLSDDANKIPLKVKAKMFIGSIELDIKSQNGLRNPLRTY